MKTAKKNNKVKVEYTGTLKSGEVFGSSKDSGPIEFEVGAGKVIQGFDKGVEGMKEEEEKTIKIPAEEAYGPVKEDLIYKINKEAIPKDINVEVGLNLVSKQPDGNEIPVVVSEVGEETVTIDANHPLAGEDLTFNVKLLEIVE